MFRRHSCRAMRYKRASLGVKHSAAAVRNTSWLSALMSAGTMKFWYCKLVPPLISPCSSGIMLCVDCSCNFCSCPSVKLPFKSLEPTSVKVSNMSNMQILSFLLSFGASSHNLPRSTYHRRAVWTEGHRQDAYWLSSRKGPELVTMTRLCACCYTLRWFAAQNKHTLSWHDKAVERSV